MFLVGATLLGTSSLSTLGVVGVVIEVFSLNLNGSSHVKIIISGGGDCLPLRYQHCGALQHSTVSQNFA